MILLTAEIQKLVRAANITLLVNDKDLNPTSLTVEKNSLLFTVSKKDSDTLIKATFPSDHSELVFEPTTLCNLSGKVFERENCKELNFRVNVSTDIVEILEPDNKRLSKDNHSANSFCFCASCHFKLGQVICDRVVDLPSSNWRELASEWFCHKHGHEDTSSGSDNFLERLDFMEKDFVVGPTQIYFQTHCLNLCSSLVLGRTGESVFCPRCLSILGTVDVSPLRGPEERESHDKRDKYCCFLKHKVLFSQDDENSTPVKRTEKMLNDLMVNIICKDSSPIMPTKFCLESENPTEDGKCLLLWVMDRNLLRFTATLVGGENRDVELEPSSVVKVSYNVVDRDSAKHQLWKKTFDCEVEKVQRDTLWDTVYLLQKSTEKVPHSQRIIDDFVIGFFDQL